MARGFDPAKLYLLEQARDHSIKLIKEWLPKYKFKDWAKTDARGIGVTDSYRQERAENTAKVLGNPDNFHSHSRGISLKALTSDLIKPKAVDFGEDDALNKAVREYNDLFIDYCNRIGANVAVHTECRLWANP